MAGGLNPKKAFELLYTKPPPMWAKLEAQVHGWFAAVKSAVKRDVEQGEYAYLIMTMRDGSRVIEKHPRYLAELLQAAIPNDPELRDKVAKSKIVRA
jgi:hypothetical protein